MRNTTPEDFTAFKQEVMRWVSILNLQNWSIQFLHANLDAEGANAKLHTSSCTTATITLATHIEELYSITEYAKHEAIHLLLSTLSRIASERFISESELYREEENIVRILQRILPNASSLARLRPHKAPTTEGFSSLLKEIEKRGHELSSTDND